MKARIGTFQLSLILTALIVLFTLLMMWPNKASYFHDAPKQAAEYPQMPTPFPKR